MKLSKELIDAAGDGDIERIEEIASNDLPSRVSGLIPISLIALA